MIMNDDLDKNVMHVKDPSMGLSRAIQRMDEEVPPINKIPMVKRHFTKLPPLPALPAKQKNALLDLDSDLKTFLTKREVRTLVVGVGGAGNNMTSRFQQMLLPGCRTLCVNTDVQDLYYSNADEKILIGKQLTKGLGAGNDHQMGELAALEDYDRLVHLLDADIVFLTCGLGGGTGTGATPLIAKAAKESGAMVISIATMPFKMEGITKERIAFQGLKNLADHSDTTIPLSNQKLISLVPNIKIHQGFKIMDEILIRSVKGIINLITKPGLVNLDFADIQSIIKRKSQALEDAMYSTSVIGMTEVSKFSDNHLKHYTVKALDNPLIEPEIGDIKNALVGIAGDSSVKLKQVDTVVATVSEKIHPDANLKWGFISDNNLNGKMRITVMGHGFKSPVLEKAIMADYTTAFT
ncbi:cell division protein FtsZ [Candidatus Bathyarchaeota archaeon]|nr:cell division protein FtsZ [Candidatus Bathyarchaeota archaeon]